MNKFQNGTVADVAANPSSLFVVKKDGQVCCSQDGQGWFNVFDYDEEDRHSVRMAAAGASFALGATDNETVVFIKPQYHMNGKVQKMEVAESNFGEDMALAKIVGMDGSTSFACVLVKVKMAEDDNMG